MRSNQVGNKSPCRATDVCAVICTRNRPAQLQRALTSLMEQTLAPSEVMVVDNAPKDDITKRMVENEFPTVRYVQELTPGLSRARNRSLRESRYEIIAFIDDDAVADPDWVVAIQAVFHENPTIAVCTGKVRALSLETAGQLLFEANGGFERGNSRIRLPRDVQKRLSGLPAPLIAWSISVGTGCSLAVRREKIIEIGGFDEMLGMGAAIPGSEDLDIIWRTLKAGDEVVYEPGVQAAHEHRREVAAAVYQILEYNRVLIAWLTKVVAMEHGPEKFWALMFLLWRLMKPGVRLGRRVLGQDPLPSGILLRLWWNGWRGLGAFLAAQQPTFPQASGKKE